MSEINTVEIVNKLKEKLKIKIELIKKSGIEPKLFIMQDTQTKEECDRYTKGKHKISNELGIKYEDMIIYTEGKAKEEIIEAIKSKLKFIKDPTIIQMPFTNITSDDIAEIIPFEIDVDGLSIKQKEKLAVNSKDILTPCTAFGCIKLLKELYDDLTGKTICIVNRSNLIGRPLVKLALNENMIPIVCHSKTPEWKIKEFMSKSDIIVTGCGKRKIFDVFSICDENLNTRVETILDCSMARVDGILNVGDFDKESILEIKPNIKIASGYKHLGLMTTYCLMENTIKYYENKLVIK